MSIPEKKKRLSEALRFAGAANPIVRELVTELSSLKRLAERVSQCRYSDLRRRPKVARVIDARVARIMARAAVHARLAKESK